MNTEAPIRILVVDDNPVTVEVTVRALEPVGYQVSKAFSGEEALALIRSQPPDLILLDREMSGLSGMEVCRQLKEDPAFSKIFIVFASAAKIEITDRVGGLDAGADGYITRPVGDDELRARVAAYVRIIRLNNKLDARTQELERTNKILFESRQAALNLMEDAVQAKEKTQKALEDLRESEIRYHRVVDLQEDAIFRWMPDTTITFANQKYMKLFGVMPDEFGKQKWLDLVPECDRPKFASGLQELLRNPKRRLYEHTAILKDGLKRYIQWTDIPIPDENGVCIEFQSVGRDVTELRESESKSVKLLNAIERSPSTIVITDRNGVIEYVNPKFTQVSGYTAAEAIGQNPRVLKSGETSPDEYKIMWATLNAGQDWHGEFHNKRKDGTFYWELASISPLRDENGNITHFVAVKEEISARKEMEARLRFLSKRSTALLDLSVQASRLNEYAFMEYALDKVENLTGSSVSFIHLVNDDQKTIELVTWSKRTIKDSCTAGFDRHYPIEKAGIWAEAFRKKKPMLYNDYAKAADRCGLPEGHIHLDRLISLPVMEGERVCMLIGIGNKKTDYTDTDVETLQLMANDIWRILRQKRSDIDLRLSQELLEETGQAGGVGGWELNVATKEVRWTKQTRLIHEVDDSYQPNFDTAVNFYDLEGRHELTKTINEAITTGKPWDLELPFTTAKGRRIWVRAMGQARFENGLAVKLLGTFQDITPRRNAEKEREALNAQLAQAQKMESIGLLAGGIAHEFNNKLQAILGFTELATLNSAPNSPLINDLREIKKAAEHSANLTRQLLAYASKQMVTPVHLNLNEAINLTLRMVRQLVGESIEVHWHPAVKLWTVNIDPNQVDQILTNLAVNARDAMNGVGNLTFRTRNVTLTAKDAFKPVEQLDGDYVELSIADSGCGMSQTLIKHIFEPFFTTKPFGKGTGLGLPTVYGIVRQNRGFIRVQSEVGKGSTFFVYFPRDFSESMNPDAAMLSALPRGSEAILLVEDEAAILRMARITLENLGYTVLKAASPKEALDLAARYAGKLDLLLTDVVMPGMDGRELYNALSVARPELKALFMSGHTSDSLGSHGVVPEGHSFLPKPFVLRDLAKKVRAVLDAKG